MGVASPSGRQSWTVTRISAYQGSRGLTATLRSLRITRHPRARHGRAIEGVRAQLTMPVDPNLGLWQQPQVHTAGLQCSLAVAGSFLAAQLLNRLISRAVHKVQ